MPRPRSFDEAQVLERAVELFRSRGFEGIRMPELVDSLGICRQSLYNTFGDKRGLYLAALERYGEREVDSKLELLESGDSPLESLRTVLRGWAALATQCPGQGCFTVVAIVENSCDHEALELVERQVQRLEAGFRGALERARAAGELRPDAQPARLASALTSTCYGLGLLARLPGSGTRIGESVSVMLGLLDDACTGNASA